MTTPERAGQRPGIKNVGHVLNGECSPSLKPKTRDNIAYLSIAFVVVAIGAAVAFYEAQRGGSYGIPLRPVSAVAFSALVFGYGVFRYKILWKYTRFWLVILLALGAHSLVYLAIFHAFEKAQLVILGLLCGPEVAVLFWLIDTVFHPHDNSTRRMAHPKF